MCFFNRFAQGHYRLGYGVGVDEEGKGDKAMIIDDGRRATKRKRGKPSIYRERKRHFFGLCSRLLFFVSRYPSSLVVLSFCVHFGLSGLSARASLRATRRAVDPIPCLFSRPSLSLSSPTHAVRPSVCRMRSRSPTQKLNKEDSPDNRSGLWAHTHTQSMFVHSLK